MLQVELSKSQFLALAERMANEAFREKSLRVEVNIDYDAMHLIDDEIEIEYIYRGEKAELWDFALELLATSDYIVLK